MECISDYDHRAQWSFLGLLHGLRQHVADIDVTAAIAFDPVYDSRHVDGVDDPTPCNPAAARPGGIVGAVKGELHLQAAAGCRLEHPTLQYLGAVPGGLPMVGKREDDARLSRHGLLLAVGFVEHA